jgi:hypothetical protein
MQACCQITELRIEQGEPSPPGLNEIIVGFQPAVVRGMMP